MRIHPQQPVPKKIKHKIDRMKLDREKVVNDIYQILGEFGRDREDIKSRFRELCNHYKSLDSPDYSSNVFLMTYEEDGVTWIEYNSEYTGLRCRMSIDPKKGVLTCGPIGPKLILEPEVTINNQEE